MKRSRFSYEAASPPSSGYHHQAYSFDRYNTSSAQVNYSAIVEDSIGPTEQFDTLQHYLGSLGDGTDGESYDAQANTLNQSDVVRSNADVQRTQSPIQQSLHSQHDTVLRGDPNYAELAGSNRAVTQTRRTQQHNHIAAASSPYSHHRMSLSFASQPPAVTPMSNPPAFPAESLENRTTPYSPYRGLFPTSDEARDHRHMSTRFGRHPYIDTEDDPTISEVECSRDHHVGRIYDAMIRGDRAQDNPGSIAMKRWVLGAHYKSDLVEAFAHKVFDCLLVQVKEGFRGWHHNDYVDDDRKGEREDRETDCMGRLDNIIDALEREKTICEDVVNSASQIRMFVNAPIAYAARKYQNRLGNSKRGRTREIADLSSRPARMRRVTGRPTRARSTFVSDLPASRDTTPQFSTPATTVTPYYATPCSLGTHSSPAETHLSPRQPFQKPGLPRSGTSVAERQVTATARPVTSRQNESSYFSQSAMSPPSIPAPRAYNTNRTTVPPAQMLPTQLPLPSDPMASPLPYSASHSAPLPRNDAKIDAPATSAISADSADTWPSLDALEVFNPSFDTPIDPSLTPGDHISNQYAWSNAPSPTHALDVPTNSNPDANATHFSLADIEHIPLQHVNEFLNDPANEFVSFWNEQDGVQNSSFE